MVVAAAPVESITVMYTGVGASTHGVVGGLMVTMSPLTVAVSKLGWLVNTRYGA